MNEEDSDEPIKLYKYFSVDENRILWIREAIRENRVYYSSIEQFNDPFEGHLTMTYDAPFEMKEARAREHIMRQQPELSMQEISDLVPERIAYAEQHGLSNLKDLRKKIGIYCLSQKRDDILMWSHYACSHRGICIEFSATEQAHVVFMGQAFRVVYQNLFPCVNLYNTSLEDKAKAYILTKSQHWSYECEWRVIDFPKPSGYRSIPPRLISSVILGAKATDETREAIKQLLSGLAWTVKLYQARMNSDNYGLEIVSD